MISQTAFSIIISLNVQRGKLSVAITKTVLARCGKSAASRSVTLWLYVTATSGKTSHFFLLNPDRRTEEGQNYSIKQAQIWERRDSVHVAWLYKCHFIRRRRSIVSITLVEIENCVAAKGSSWWKTNIDLKTLGWDPKCLKHSLNCFFHKFSLWGSALDAKPLISMLNESNFKLLSIISRCLR